MSRRPEMRLFDMSDEDEAGRDERPTGLEQPLASGAGVVRGDRFGNVLAVELERTRLPQVGPAVLTAQLTEAIQQLQRRAADIRRQEIRQRSRKVRHSQGKGEMRPDG